MRRALLLLPFALVLAPACGGDDPPPDTTLDAAFLDATAHDIGVASDGGVFSGNVLLDTQALSFGRVVLGTTGQRSFTLSNQGTQPVEVRLSAPEGAGAAVFTRSPNVLGDGAVFTVEPAGVVTVTVVAEPSAEGVFEASLTVDACGGSCPALVALSAEGARTGIRCPASVDFGVVNAGDCRSQTIRCANEGNATERVTTIEIEPTSDLGFELADPVLPAILDPAEGVDLELSFCPAADGAKTGELLLLTFEPFQTEIRVALTGQAGGPNLECAPAVLSFGDVGIGATVRASVLCTNAGSVATSFAARVVMPGAFSLANTPPTSLAAGAIARLEVAFMPSALGAATGELEITSEDPDAPTLTVPIDGRGIDVGPCTATLLPDALDFGLVARGDRRELPLYVRNEGSDPCLLRALDFVTGMSPPFGTRNAPVVGEAIAPGELRAFFVSYGPLAAGPDSGRLEIAFSNPGTNQLFVNLSGVGGDAAVSPSPAAVDFGPTPLGCAEPARRALELVWIAEAAGELSTVTLTSGAGVFSIEAGALPVTLGLGERHTISVGFAPPAAGVYQGELSIFAAGQAEPVVVPLLGVGGGPASRAETFDVGAPRVDVLFVVDDSLSMGAAQAGLAAAMPLFDAALDARAADVQVAFITTDMEDPSRQGRFFGNPAVLTTASAGRLDQLVARAQAGTAGAGVEQGLAAILAAVTEPLRSGENAGFLRPGADLAVILISDEDDQSPDPPSATLEALRAASGSGRVFVDGFVAPAGGACIGPHGLGAAAPRYAEIFTRAGGVPGRFCRDFAEGMTDIADRILAPLSFTLGAEPVINTIAVTVAGVAAPPADWAYERAQNRVVFTGARPAAGATIGVSYDVRCVSASCGDGATGAGEQCDDMNASVDDACVGCYDAVCGDAFVRSGVEDCDDGDLDNGDACLSTCAAAGCGDGFIQRGVEECDDGNTAGGDGCPAACRFYASGGVAPQAFQALVNPSPLSFGGATDPLDDGFAEIPMPFSFSLYDVPTATLAVSINGFLSFQPIDVAVSYENVAIPTADPPNAIVAPWWYDLVSDPGVPGGSAVSYQVQGAAPNRVLVVEWRNVRPYDHSTNGHRRFSFQAALFEASGAIELRYGDTVSANAPTAVAASAGIEDQAGGRGLEALGCSPNCDGRPRPMRPDGFPAQSVVVLSP